MDIFREVDPTDWTVEVEVKELFSVLLSLLKRGMQKMSRKRRNHSPEFKSKVALAAVKGDQTLSELSRQYGINSNLIVKWKKQLIEQSSEVLPRTCFSAMGFSAITSQISAEDALDIHYSGKPAALRCSIQVSVSSGLMNNWDFL